MGEEEQLAVTAEEIEDLADHRPDVYEEEGRWVFRASSFGGCESNLVRQAVGMTPDAPPEFLARGYAEGSHYEAEVLAAFSEQCGFRMLRPGELESRYGWGSVQGNGQIELDVPVPGGVVRVHPDGVAKCFKRKPVEAPPYELGELRVVEAKVLVEGSQPMSNPNYPWQLSIEMAATKLPGVFVVAWKDKETRELIRHADGNIKLTVAWYKYPPHRLGEIKARAARLGKLIRAFDDGGGVPACDRKQFPCGFWKDHDQKVGVWAEVEGVEVKGLADIFDDEYRAASEEYTRLGQLIDQRKAEALALLTIDGHQGKCFEGEIKVTRVVVEAGTTLNTDAMKQDGVYDTYKTKPKKGSDYVKVGW